MPAKKRIGYIDIAKCIAIAFIIIGHMGLVYSASTTEGGMPHIIVQLAFTFHLPVFFIASGYFFSETKAFSGDFLKKDIISLLLPYAVTSVLIIIGCALMAPSYGLTPVDEIVRWGKAAIWGAGSVSDVALWHVERIGGIWFLWAMFWAHMLLVATHKINEWTRLLTMAMCTVVAMVSARYVWLPFSIQSGLGCAIFLYIGMLARKHGMFDKKSIPIVAMILMLAIWAYVIRYGGGMSIAMQIYPLGAIDIVGGVAATAVIMTGSRLIEDHAAPVSKFMQWIGRNTLAIFCLHIVEDNVLHWWEIGPAIGQMTGNWEFTWILVLLLRFALDAVLVALMYVIPGIRKVYFPQLKKSAGDETAMAKDKKTLKVVAGGLSAVAVVAIVVYIFAVVI